MEGSGAGDHGAAASEAAGEPQALRTGDAAGVDTGVKGFLRESDDLSGFGSGWSKALSQGKPVRSSEGAQAQGVSKIATG